MTKRVMLIAQTLDLVSSLSKSEKSTAYVAPSKNIPMVANFCCRGSCSLDTIGIGIPRIMKSMIMSLIHDAYHIETASMHLLP